MLCRVGFTERRLGAFPEILLEDIWFERAARFAGNDEQGARDIDRAVEMAYLRRIGGIEHVQPGKARAGAKGLRQHFGTEAGAAHAEQHRIGEPGTFHLVRKSFEAPGILQLGFGNGEPAEPLRLVGVGPQRGIAVP